MRAKIHAAVTLAAQLIESDPSTSRTPLLLVLLSLGSLLAAAAALAVAAGRKLRRTLGRFYASVGTEAAEVAIAGCQQWHSAASGMEPMGVALAEEREGKGGGGGDHHRTVATDGGGRLYEADVRAVGAGAVLDEMTEL